MKILTYLYHLLLIVNIYLSFFDWGTLQFKLHYFNMFVVLVMIIGLFLSKYVTFKISIINKNNNNE